MNYALDGLILERRAPIRNVRRYWRMSGLAPKYRKNYVEPEDDGLLVSKYRFYYVLEKDLSDRIFIN